MSNSLRRSSFRVLALLVALVASLPLMAMAEPPKPNEPRVAPASKEAVEAIGRFRVPPGLKVDLVAAEPQMANPVSFAFDPQGRIYVCESFRQEKGVVDNRGHMEWLDDDLAAQTVEDRLAFYQKHLGAKLAEYSSEDDRIRLLEDTNGDFKVDGSSVFASGFNDVLEGTGAGVLAWHGNVYYTCIPNLWLLRDTHGTGKADFRKSLHYGYGVRVAFRGHDSHGLRMGPDGKLYFSIGDRGVNIETEGHRIKYPDRGAVFRCNPDGSQLEAVHTGLRNPQELAFDEFGNLFTGDNNSDSGDKARWVYVVEGGESGWRMYYQYLADRGPFNREKLWYPQHEGQAAYIVPPIANVADGPSGLTYAPGTGLPKEFQHRFYLCDFRGGAANSGVRSFANKPKGASFELVDSQEFFWSILCTDVDFGPDGGLYVSDWVDSWSGVGKGRLYRLSAPGMDTQPQVKETRKLLAEGFEQRSTAELVKLLEHPDQRVRQEAEFALAAQGEKAIAPLTDVATKNKNLLARLHAMWGLGIVGRTDANALEPFVGLAADTDAEVRAQSAKLLGEAAPVKPAELLIKLLSDESPRVRFFAAISLGKLHATTAVSALAEMLRQNADADAYLRHAGVMGLTGIFTSGDKAQLAELGHDASPSVRLATALVYRRLESPDVAALLNDSEMRVVDEAARAIYDLPIEPAMPKLAALSARTGLSEPTLRRVMAANFYLGKSENAAAVAAIAGRHDVAETLRLEALDLLSQWAKPSSHDHILGAWRPLAPRSPEIASSALRSSLGSILVGSDLVRQKAAQVAAPLGIKEVAPLLAELVADAKLAPRARAEALSALGALGSSQLPHVVDTALADPQPLVRASARRVMVKLDPKRAMDLLRKTLGDGELAERQAALDTLTTVKTPEAEQLVAMRLDELLAGKLPPQLELDVLEAGKQLKGSGNLARIAKYESQRKIDDPLAPYHETLLGGDAERGRRVFFEKSEASCLRCHKIGGQGGEVGPDLSKVAADKPREYLLESIVKPNAKIAKGFETVVINTTDGRTLTGVLKSETDHDLKLITAEAKTIVIAKEQIDQRASGQSPMPEKITGILSKAELRDLVEFLSQQK